MLLLFLCFKELALIYSTKELISKTARKLCYYMHKPVLCDLE